VSDQILYQAGPDEVIEYARIQEIAAGNVLGPQPSDTHHDVIVAFTGTGTVRWDGGNHELVNGQPVVLPHGVHYELAPAPDQDLQVMIFGVAPKSQDAQERA